MARPFMTDCATRPCWAQSQIGVSPARPWWSALNHAATSPSRTRSLTTRMPPPRWPTYTESPAFPGDLIPEPPHLGDPVHVRLVVAAVDRAPGVGLLGRHPAQAVVNLPAALAVADPQRARARPAVREEPVGRVAAVDLPIDGGHVLGKVVSVLTGLLATAILPVPPRSSDPRALNPPGVALGTVR